MYDGDWSYDSLKEYMDGCGKILSRRGNANTLALDRSVRRVIDEIGRDNFLKLKKDNYNLSLEGFVLNSGADHLYSVVGNSIVPRSGYIFLTPRSRNGRAPFYSGVKVLGSYEIDTLWYNTGVLLLMCLLLTLCLLFNFPGKKLAKIKN